ncbi:MAG: response regulator transcription factor [Nitrospirae bacterium]|nr:response regulator transcription factor [Nitrospirota bacterium]
MINVVIADDHCLFRDGLKSLLLSDKDLGIVILGEAQNGQEALSLIEEKAPDIAVVDISMPILNGIEVIKSVNEKELATKIVILTMHNDQKQLKLCLKLGAYGYVLKDNAFEELKHAIQNITNGKKYITPSLIFETIDLYEDEVSILTNREKEILVLIAKGLSSRKIAQLLYISIKTVETHRTKIMKKLDVHKTSELVRYAINMGLTK